METAETVHGELVYFTNSKGQKLEGLLMVPSAPREVSIVLCHGFASSKDVGIISKLSRRLYEGGYAVLSFDFSGHGKSEGDFEHTDYSDYIEDTLSAKRFMRTRGFDNIALLGHSMGAVIAAEASTRIKDLSALMLIAPAVGIKQSPMSDTLVVEAMTGGHVIFTDPNGKEWKVTRHFLTEMKDHDIMKMAVNINIPCLIVLAKKDIIVDNAAAQAFFEEIESKKKMRVLEDAGHLFLADGAADDIASIVKDFLE